MDEIAAASHIDERIRVIRGQRVILDSDLASLYDVRTSRLLEQVRRLPIDETRGWKLEIANCDLKFGSRCTSVPLLHLRGGTKRIPAGFKAADRDAARLRASPPKIELKSRVARCSSVRFHR